MGNHSPRESGQPPEWHPEAAQTWPPPTQAAIWQPPTPPFGPPAYYFAPPPDDPRIQIGIWAGAGAVVLAGIGMALQFQSVSLLTGDGIYWIGAALAVIGAALSFVAHRRWIKIVAVTLAVLCVLNVGYTEKQLDDRRNQIQQDFSNLNVTPTS